MSKSLKTSTLGVAVLSAMLPLFCCWGPTLLVGVAILSGVATNMAWLHPYEPWLYAISFSVLGYSHFNAAKINKNVNNCDSCSVDEVTNQKIKFKNITLWLATFMVLIMFLVNMFPEIIG